MEAEARTDEALATATAAGDSAAFAVLYERYALRIHDFAARITRSREDGADVTQITFERAWRNLARRRPDRLFKPWLFSIAHHAALDLLRRPGRRRPRLRRHRRRWSRSRGRRAGEELDGGVWAAAPPCPLGTGAAWVASASSPLASIRALRCRGVRV